MHTQEEKKEEEKRYFYAMKKSKIIKVIYEYKILI